MGMLVVQGCARIIRRPPAFTNASRKQPDMEWIAVYFGIGVVAGTLAGMLGVGGGGLIVPMMVAVFAAQDFPRAEILHLAVGTSMASIIFTSIAEGSYFGELTALDGAPRSLCVYARTRAALAMMAILGLERLRLMACCPVCEKAALV